MLLQIFNIQKVKENTQLYTKAIFSCKEKGLSQDELAKMIGTSGPINRRYEREEIKPSIDVVSKIADILDASLDYLTGKIDVEMDKTTKKWILEVSKFDTNDQEHIFSVIDAFIAKRKIQSII